MKKLLWISVIRITNVILIRGIYWMHFENHNKGYVKNKVSPIIPGFHTKEQEPN